MLEFDIDIYQNVQLIKSIWKIPYRFAQKVYSTLDQNHPGVNSVFNLKDKLIGGKIFLIIEPKPVFKTNWN